MNPGRKVYTLPTQAMLDEVALEPVDLPEDGTLHVTHRGVLRVGGNELLVYQLNDGRRVWTWD